MGNTFKTGNYVNGIFQDTSNNIGIGAAPSGTYKFEITGTSKVSGVLTLGATLSNGTYTYTLPAATGTLALVGGAGVGTVTSVAALTLGTTGTDLSSTVANSTTTPVITLNVPTASATNRGALSSADFTTFNSKQGTITLTTTGTSGAATFSSNTLNIPNYGSALSGYLPLTGGTLTGALYGTSASFTGNVVSTLGFLQFANNYGIEGRNAANTAYRTVLKLNSSNQIEIGRDTDISAIILGTASATNALTIASTGAATFSSSVTASSTKAVKLLPAQSAAVGLPAGSAISSTGSFSIYSDSGISGETQGLYYWNGSTYYAALQTSNVASGFSNLLLAKDGGNVGIGTSSPLDNLHIAASEVGNVGISVQNTNASYSAQLRFLNSAGTEKAAVTYVQSATSMNFNINSIESLVLASTGAATFSSSVTAAGYLISGDNVLKLNSIASVQDQQIYYQNNGTTKFQLFLNTATNSFGIYNNALGSSSFTITSGGNVLIGTTTDDTVNKLQVSGKGYFSNLLSVGLNSSNDGLSTNTKLRISGDGSPNAGASMGSCFAAAGSGSGYDTGISVNMGTSGATMLLMASINTSTGTSTNSAVYIVRFYFSGNNLPSTTYLGGSSDFVTFSVSGSNTLILTASNSGNRSYSWFFNKIESN